MRKLHLVPGVEAEWPPAITAALEFAEAWVGPGGDIGTDTVALLADEFDVSSPCRDDFVVALQARGHAIVVDDVVDPDAGADTSRAFNGFDCFLRSTAHRVLTAAEECELARRIADGKCAVTEIEAGTVPEDVRPRLERLVRRGRRAEDEFLRHNLRLVLKLAKMYQGRGLELEDLFQEGVFGLHRAVHKFDHTKGFKFSTYATWWVRQSITRAVANQARTIRIPIHMIENMNRVRAAEWRLEASPGREPTEREVAAEAGVDVATVRKVRAIRSAPVSLDVPESTFAGSEEDAIDSVVDLDDVVDRIATCGVVRDALSHLTEREQIVLRRRFGFDGGEIQTLEAVGREFGRTRERIRQIESKVLEKLRASSEIQEARELLESA